MERPDIDFQRSFLKFTTARVNHTPRLQIAARCVLVPPDGPERAFFLTAECISENMYVEDCLVQQPASEFLMIASRDGEYMFMKRHASARYDVREAHCIGEAMSTHDGRGAPMKKIEIDVVRFTRSERIESYPDIRESILGNCLLNGRTTCLDEDSETRIVMDYPIRVCNVAHDRPLWQVDVGRVLGVGGPASSSLEVERLAPAYLVYNSWNWTDIAFLAASPSDNETGVSFCDVRRLKARNEIFRVG